MPGLDVSGFDLEPAHWNVRNVVTQALGGNSEPKVDVLEVAIDEDDTYLLCSDGLNSMLTDDEIAVATQRLLDGLVVRGA